MVDSLVILDDEDFDALDEEPVSIVPFRNTFWVSASAMDEVLDDEDDLNEFLGGPPRLEVVYAEHPMRNELWLPVADYHRLVFEDKVAEAMELLMLLGARHVEAEHLDGWGREVVGQMSFPAAGVRFE